MPNYNALANTAKRLIEAAGRTVTVRAPGALVDPLKPWLGHLPGASVDVKATFVEYSRRFIDGTTIQQGDKRCFIAARSLDIDLSTAETVTDGLRVLKVLDVGKVQPGDVVISYELQVR